MPQTWRCAGGDCMLAQWAAVSDAATTPHVAVVMHLVFAPLACATTRAGRVSLRLCGEPVFRLAGCGIYTVAGD